MYFRKVPVYIQKLFPQIIWSAQSDPRLHLTFDDGPHPQSTPALLHLLDKLNLKATFFCLGHKLEAHPELGEEIRAQGHHLANHGYRHLSGWSTPKRSYLSNAEKGAQLSNSNFYRPPYGRMKRNQYAELRKKYQIIMWSSMPGDFDLNVTQESLAHRLSMCTKEDIIVLHDQPETIEKLTYALSTCYR